MKEKIIINIQPTHNSVEYLIREGQYQFKGTNGYWPTVCLVSREQFAELVQYFRMQMWVNQGIQPIGGLFSVKIESVELKIIAVDAIRTRDMEFH